MKTLITVLGIIYSTIAYGQSCFCEKDTTLSEIISCDSVRFANKAKLYWSFNCDSSWLTFVSPMGQKEIIFSLGDGLQHLTGRLGYTYAEEYKHTFLIQNNVISGCCSPPEFYLYDKLTGKLKKSLGRLVYFSNDKSLPIVISVTNSNYDTSVAVKAYLSLTIYNTDKNKVYLLNLPKDEIKKALQENEEMYPEYLFEEPTVDNGVVILIYHKSKSKTSQEGSLRKISINLKKYN